MQPLTPAQQKVLRLLTSFQTEKGYTPSFRELSKSCGFKSLDTIHFHLNRLKEKGYIKFPPYQSRHISLRREHPAGSIPVLGMVPAGNPLSAIEEHDEYIEVDPSIARGTCFGLRVKGDSMKEAGILSGDIVVVRRQSAAKNGDIVVARFEDEATVKYLRHINRDAYLVPANDHYKPIPAKDAELIGKVTGVIRRYG